MANRMATLRGKTYAQNQLERRRDNPPKPIDNSRLPAGSPMYFYCISCGAESDVKPEGYTDQPKRLCDECKAMFDLGWLTGEGTQTAS